MKTLLELQKIDLAIDALRDREAQIPKQKKRFDIHRKRLTSELEEREAAVKALVLEQRECEGDIEQKQAQVTKYDQQLAGIKKNEEYKALLHEIEMVKKQVGIKEERILEIMQQIEDVRARLEEDKKRLDEEVTQIEAECAKVDAELSAVIDERKQLEAQRKPLLEKVEPDLLRRYNRIRKSKKEGPAVVPMNGQSCSGCFMAVRPQMVNEVLAGKKVHACAHCGRLLYWKDNFADEDSGPADDATA